MTSGSSLVKRLAFLMISNMAVIPVQQEASAPDLHEWRVRLTGDRLSPRHYLTISVDPKRPAPGQDQADSPLTLPGKTAGPGFRIVGRRDLGRQRLPDIDRRH